MSAPRQFSAQRIARQLMEDHRAGKQFAPFAAVSGIRSAADAYDVQRAYVEFKQSQTGARRSGYKIGLTSRKMQEMCGISNPVAGVMLADGMHVSPAVIDGKPFGRFGLEFEIAVLIGKDIAGQSRDITLSDIARSVSGASSAIELVDDRNCEYASLEALSLIADNAWNAGIVHGPFVRSGSDLADVEGIAFADGAEVGRGFGRDALGHPFLALTWLANHLAERGEQLRAGDIVMTGSIVPTQFPKRTTDYRFEVAGIGAISCRVLL